MTVEDDVARLKRTVRLLARTTIGLAVLSVAIVVGGLQLAGYQVRKIERSSCPLAVVVVQAYQQYPPTTASGRNLAQAERDFVMRNHCQGV